MQKRKCISCRREFQINKLTKFVRFERRVIPTWGFREGLHEKEITMPVANLLVCEECFVKLTDEQELRLKGLVKCEYCDTVH